MIIICICIIIDMLGRTQMYCVPCTMERIEKCIVLMLMMMILLIIIIIVIVVSSLCVFKVDNIVSIGVGIPDWGSLLSGISLGRRWGSFGIV